MFSWVKSNAVLVLVSALATLVATSSFLFVMWRGAENDAKEAREFMRVQGRIIEAHNRIAKNEEQVDRVVVDVIQRVMEAPNADTPVPPDVATAWLDGINSVRDREAAANQRTNDLSGPTGTNAGNRKPDDRRINSDLNKTGSSVPKVQLPLTTDSKHVRG